MEPQMRAVVFEGAREVACISMPQPRITCPRDAIVKVRAAGLCGSDMHPYRGNEIIKQSWPEVGIEKGTVMGHEFVGVVSEVGPEVKSFKPGDRVCAPFTVSCGECYYCGQGYTARCDHSQLFGWLQNGKGIHGAQAEYVLVPHAEGTLFKVPHDVTDDEALLLGDVVPTGYYAARQAHDVIGNKGVYVVLGCGPVGLAAIAGALEHTASRVYAVDTVTARLELAERYGAIPVQLNADDNGDSVVARIVAETEGRGSDAVLDCVGSEAATLLAYRLVRCFGVMSIVGVHTEPHFAISPDQAYDKNLTIRIGRCPAKALADKALELVRSRRYPFQELISHRIHLEQASDAYVWFDTKQHGCTKVAFYPELQ